MMRKNLVSYLKYSRTQSKQSQVKYSTASLQLLVQKERKKDIPWQIRDMHLNCLDILELAPIVPLDMMRWLVEGNALEPVGEGPCCPS